MERVIPKGRAGDVRLTAAVAASILLGGLPAAKAEERSARVELSLGYAFLWAPDSKPTTLPVGLSTGLAFNPTRSLGIVGDYGVSYHEGPGEVSEQALLGGVRYSLRGSAVVPYVEALGGAVRRGEAADGPTASTWHNALQIGAGLAFHIRADTFFRISADFRNVFVEGASSRRFRTVAGVTVGLRPRSGGGSSGLTAVPARVPPEAPQPGSLSADEPAAPPASTPPVLTPAPAPTPVPTPPALVPSSAPRPKPVRAPVSAPMAPPSVAFPFPEALTRGRDRLRDGQYSEASRAFREDLRPRAADRFTLAVGLYCETASVERLVQGPGSTEALFVLPSRRSGRACYAVCWGLFGSVEEALQALDSLPVALRTPGQTPIAVSRLLR